MDFNTSSDASLWQLAVVGRNEDACRELVGRHHPLVRGVCNQLLLCADDVEEACQVTFLTLLESGDSIRNDDFSAWLYRVAWRASQRVRSDARRTTPQSRDGIPDAATADAFARIEESERGHQVSSAVDRLPQRYRDVLILHYVKGLAREQVARRLQISLQAVKGRLARGRDLLRSRLLKKGISLAAVAAVFASQSEASIANQQDQLLWDNLRQWFDGTPVSIARIQLTDLTRKDFGMYTQNGLLSKLTATGLLLAALCIAFVVGRMSPVGGFQQANAGLDARVPDAATAPIGSLVDLPADEMLEPPILLVSAQETPRAIPQPTVPAALSQLTHLQPTSPQPTTAQPTTAQPASQEQTAPQPVVQRRWNPQTAPAQPAPVAATTPQMPPPALPATAITQVSANRVQPVQSPRGGLPEGTWVRNSPLGAVTSVVNGRMITLNVSVASMPGLKFQVKAEHSVASDGTIYGIVHGVDVDTPAPSEELAELAALSMMGDMPFLLRVHTDADTVTIKGVNVGPPSGAGAEGADFDVLQVARMVFAGTFHKEK